jgi:hypothetical protein
MFFMKFLQVKKNSPRIFIVVDSEGEVLYCGETEKIAQSLVDEDSETWYSCIKIYQFFGQDKKDFLAS